MIRQYDGKVGTRELFAIIVLSIGIKAAEVSPTILFKFAKTATWMVPTMSLISIAIPFLLFISLLKKYQNKGLIELIYHLTGKYIGFLIGIIFFAITLANTVSGSRSFADIVSTMYFPKTPIVAITLLLILTGYYIANRGFETIGRTAWLVFPYITVTFLSLLIFSWSDLTFANFYPIGGPGLYEVAKESTLHNAIYFDVILLMVLFPYMRSFESFKKANFIGLSVATILFTIVLILVLLAFDYKNAETLPFVFHHLIRVAEIGSIQHIEALYLGIWVMASLIHFSAQLYILSAILAYTLKLSEFEPLILPLSGLVLMISLIPENMERTIFTFYDNLMLVTSLFIFSLSILLWIISYFKEGAKYEENN